MSWLGLLVGLVVVWLLSDVLGWHEGGLLALGAVVGALIGHLWRRLEHSQAQWVQGLAQLTAEVQALKRAAPPPSAERPTEPAPAAALPPPAPAPTHASIITIRHADTPGDDTAAQRGPDTVPAPTPLFDDEASLAVTSSAGSSLLAWFRNGNTIVRAGTLILFFGVAFLLRYATQHVTVPLELRVAAVALSGAALALLGWTLRDARRTYALTLQGAGVGIVYLTLFAAYRLYHLVPGALSFALLTVMAAVTALLAVLQQAMPLALFGFGGAFLAPVLASTGTGNHVALFSYYLIVNLAIAWIARRQAWKLLNLQGFVFTFGIGTAWGLRAYVPAYFVTAELFLVAHFLLYLAIALQYTHLLVRANEMQATALPTVDGSLLFGVPLAASALQVGMLHDNPYALALSSAVLAALYLAVGRWLWRAAGQRMLLMVEGLLALGVVFLALVTPLALDVRWTGVGWAVQGAGLLWVALRQRRGWAAGMGALLQLAAAAAFWSDYSPRALTGAFTDPWLLGAAVIAASLIVSARLLWRAAQPQDRLAWPSAADPLLRVHWGALTLGLAQALWSLWHEVERLPWPAPDHAARAGALLAAFIVPLELAGQRLRWPALRLCARALLALALLPTMGRVFIELDGVAVMWLVYVDESLLWVVLLLGALGTWLLRRTDRRDGDRTHAAEVALLGWFAMLHSGVFLYVLGVHFVAHHEGWTPAAAIVGPTGLCMWLVARHAAGRWPMQPHGTALQRAVLLPWAGMLALWVLAVNTFSDASMAPLPYLPLLNPLDLAHGLVLLYAIGLRRSGGLARSTFSVAAGGLGFWWLNGLLIRTLHHWADTPMWGQGVRHSALAQTALTILWSITACVCMWWAARRTQRAPWLAGAALLGVVVAKLFVVDLSHTGTLARIVSFIAAGLLMLLIGYVAPLPPAAQAPRRAGA